MRCVPCLPLELFPKPKKVIHVSRSFGRSVTSREELGEAIASYAARLGEKLRRQGSVAASMSVFVSTNAFCKEGAHSARETSRRFLFPTDFTPDLIETGHVLLSEIYRPGVKYRRAGVSASDIRPNDVHQPDLFSAYSLEREVKKAALMAVVDVINALSGRDVVFFAAQGLHQGWEAKSQWLSPRSTTRWSELIQLS